VNKSYSVFCKKKEEERKKERKKKEREILRV
jgi:hypothetical protein